MVLIHIPREIGSQIPSIETHVRRNVLTNVVMYMIDRKYRKIVNVQTWLKRQMNAYFEDEDLGIVAKSLIGKNHDETALNCLRYVHAHVTYTTDDQKWNMPEKWEEAKNVWITAKGDCESGAILIYVLCRLAGIPARKLWILAGDVKGGGHAWVGYIPDEYPLNFAFLDWCYWYKRYSISTRNKFTVMDKSLHEYKNTGERVTSNYYKLWFAFNENKSYRSFR